MENIIFIVFIIVFSILSTVLKSKNKPPLPKQRRPETIPGHKPYSPPEAPKSGQDILLEIERMMRGEAAPQPEYSTNKAPIPEEPVNAAPVQVEEFTDPDFAKPQFTPPEKKYEVEEKEYTNDKRFQYNDNRAILFREKARDINAMRDYFLITEILGKPKALRRR